MIIILTFTHTHNEEGYLFRKKTFTPWYQGTQEISHHKLWSQSKSGVPIKHPYKLTTFLIWEHYILTIGIYQDIDNGMMTTTNTFWVGGREKQYGVTHLVDINKTILEGEVLNKNISRIVPCWSLCWPDSFLPTYFVLILLYILCIFTCPHIRPDGI